MSQTTQDAGVIFLLKKGRKERTNGVEYQSAYRKEDTGGDEWYGTFCSALGLNY
jgi:hypothetical protein